MKYDDVLEEARTRFQRIQEDDNENRRLQREDTRFVYADDSQWDDDVRARRKEWGDPCMQFNQLKPFVNQIVNDQRQNRPGIRVHPTDGQASKETAEILQGLIRNIEYESKAEAAYDGGYQHAVVGGRGYWRIVSEYDKGFDQNLCIKRIPDPMTVYPDMDFQEPDGSDINFCFVTESITEAEFKRRWPDKDPVSIAEADEHWTDNDKIIVADYYRRVCETETLVAMSDGTVGKKADLPETLPPGIEVVRERSEEVYRVEWYKIAGGMQILEVYDWPGTMIPVVCCMGDEIMIDGKRVFQGAIRQAKSAQQMFNYGMNAQAIHLALTPRAPWVAAAGQIENYQDTWNNANRRNYSVLPYEPIDINGNPVPPPMRQPASAVDAGWFQWTQQQVALLKSTTGIYENSLGMRGQETSGRAILAREKQGDNATFHYVDNLSRAIALTGRILVECIPHYYDTQRIVHVIGVDEVRKMVTLNQNTMAPSPAPMAPFQAIKQNDVTVGEYSVVVETGPSYATKRQESADTLTQMVQAFPQLMQIAGDIVVKAQDIPDADALGERLKLMLPPPIQQALAAEEQGQAPLPPQVMQQMQGMQQQLQQAGQAVQQLRQENQQLKSGVAQKMQAAQLDAQTELQRAQFEADKEVKLAMIDQDTRLKVAEIQGNTQLMIKAMVPAVSPIPDQVPQ